MQIPTLSLCVFSPPPPPSLFNDKLSLPTARSAPTFRLTGFVYILAEDYAVVYGLARRLDSFGSCVSGKTFPGIGWPGHSYHLVTTGSDLNSVAIIGLEVPGFPLPAFCLAN